jgi:hypothetical protein
MSWDIFIQDIPASARTVRDIPDDFEPGPLGQRSQLVERILQVAPTTTFRDPAWGVFEGSGFSVEFSLGDDDTARCVALHVRGDNPAAVGLVADLITRFGWRALDPGSESGIFDPVLAADSFDKWRRYRNEVLGHTG